MKIFGTSNQDTGVYFYRVVQPLKFMGKQKLAQVHHLPIYGQHVRHLTGPEFREYFELEGKWADVIFTTLATDREYLSLILAMKELYKLKLVVDLDDDILSTHLEPNNPAYSAYLNPSGKHAEMAQACLREADLVVTSTDYLKRKYESINPNIVVIKNCIDTNFFKYKTKKNKKITIGYAGSGSHQADWNMIEPVLKELKSKYDIAIKVLGPIYTTIADEQVKWVDLLKYPESLASMGMDIGVAPLKDSIMSRGKSNLRWLEYSAMKIPTVASDVIAFRGVKNILLATEREDWYLALERLIKNKKYGTELGQNAYNEMKEYYDPRHYARQLFERISKL